MWPLRQSKSRPDWRDSWDETEEEEEGDRVRETSKRGRNHFKREAEKRTPAISDHLCQRWEEMTMMMMSPFGWRRGKNILKVNDKMHIREVAAVHLVRNLVRKLINEAPTVLQLGHSFAHWNANNNYKLMKWLVVLCFQRYVKPSKIKPNPEFECHENLTKKKWGGSSKWLCFILQKA